MSMAETGRFTEETTPHALFPLWEMVTGHQIHEPPPEPPAIWRWADAQVLIGRAVEETNTETAERRVLLMGNPNFKQGRARTQTTRTIQGAYQILMPGESARPHRHTPSALRFIFEDGGETYTVVDGKECLMQRGDIILTPADCWHGHVHRGAGRSVWFDALDSCLTGMFNAGFFEPSSKLGNYPPTMAEDSYVVPGLSPVLPDDVSAQHSPQFRYPWADSLAALAAAPSREDGSTWVRLTNPAGGALALPPMDLFLVGLSRAATRPHRTTANAVVVAAQGRGVSRVGDQELQWEQNDVFTLPQWQWASHRAESDDAVLFQVTDRGALAAMGYLKDEYR
jgi:gentisate 1,2-dioxygenase